MALFQKRPVRVLLVEDSDSDAEILVQASRQVALQTSWDRVRSAEEALIAARREHHDLALVEVGLPGMDGYGLLEALRDERGKDLMVVIISGSPSVNRPRAYRLGADGVEVKPIQPQQLQNYLRAIEKVWAEDQRRLNIPPPIPTWNGNERRVIKAPEAGGGGALKVFIAAMAAWGMR